MRHLTIDWLRRLRVEPSYRGSSGAGRAIPHLEADDDWTPAELGQLYQIVRSCEAELPIETRTILYLRVAEGAPWPDLAREMGIPATAAKRRYQRAQRSLYRHILQRVGLLSEPLRNTVLDRIRSFGVPVAQTFVCTCDPSPDAVPVRKRGRKDSAREYPP